MRKFEVYFSLLGSAVIEIEAESAEDEENMLSDFKISKLIEMAEFDNSLEIVSIDEIESLS